MTNINGQIYWQKVSNICEPSIVVKQSKYILNPYKMKNVCAGSRSEIIYKYFKTRKCKGNVYRATTSSYDIKCYLSIRENKTLGSVEAMLMFNISSNFSVMKKTSMRTQGQKRFRPNRHSKVFRLSSNSTCGTIFRLCYNMMVLQDTINTLEFVQAGVDKL